MYIAYLLAPERGETKAGTTPVQSIPAATQTIGEKSTKSVPLVASLLLVAMPFVPSSFLLLVVRPGAPSSVLTPSSV